MSQSALQRPIAPQEASTMMWDAVRSRRESDRQQILGHINGLVSKYPGSTIVEFSSNRWFAPSYSLYLPSILDEYRELGWKIERKPANWLQKIWRGLTEVHSVWVFTPGPPPDKL